jgi:hypothetical protein
VDGEKGSSAPDAAAAVGIRHIVVAAAAERVLVAVVPQTTRDAGNAAVDGEVEIQTDSADEDAEEVLGVTKASGGGVAICCCIHY